MSETRSLSLRDKLDAAIDLIYKVIPNWSDRMDAVTAVFAIAEARDALRAQEPVQVQLIAFVERERALIEARRKGQSVGYYPSITPSVLKVLERMLRDAQDEGAGPKAQAPGPRVK